MPTVQLAVKFFPYTRQAVRRHWRYALACFSVVMLLAVAGAQFLPRTYYSNARLFVRFATTSDPVASLDGTRESELNSLLQGLRSQKFLERVVDSIGPENILAGRAAEAPNAIPPSATESESHSRDPQFHQALAKLDKLVSIAVPPNTNNIIIGCKAERPELAQQVVATLVSLCMDNHLGVHHTAGSHASPEKTKLLEEQSSEAAGKLREAKNHGNIVTIDVQRKLLERQIGDLEDQLLTNSGDLTSAEAKIADLPKAIGGDQEQNSPLAAHTPPPTSLRGRAARLTEQRSQLAAKLKQLNFQHSQLAQIQREYEQAESRFRASADKLEQARIHDNLAKEPILSFTLVQPASFVPRPCGPQKIHVLGLGLVVGLLGGVGIALFAAMVNPTLLRLADIEELLQIPVIGQVRVGLA